jgi:hypothetical protein
VYGKGCAILLLAPTAAALLGAVVAALWPVLELELFALCVCPRVDGRREHGGREGKSDERELHGCGADDLEAEIESGPSLLWTHADSTGTPNLI